jgi:hypothetical protein
MTSSALPWLPASTTNQPFCGSTQTKVVRGLVKARGISSSVTRSFSSRKALRPGA